jgi:hypothetical protein
MENYLQPILHFDTKGIIWKIVYTHPSPILLLEIRYIGQEAASYTAINLLKKEIVWENLYFSNSWKTHLSDLQGTKAILVNFEDGFLPKSQGIIVLDVLTSKICWQEEALCFIKANNQYVWAYWSYDPQKKLLLVDIHTGKVLEISTLQVEKQLKEENESLKNNINSPIQTPVSYPEGSNSFKKVESFLQKNFQINAPKKIHYWENDRFFAIEYAFSDKEECLIEWRLLSAKSGECLQKQRINPKNRSENQLFASFWIVDNFLLLTPDKNQLQVYSVNE